MTFELLPQEVVVRIAQAGGGFKYDSMLKSRDQLIEIALAASRSGAKITFTGVHLRDAQEIVSIAQAGGGNITFED